MAFANKNFSNVKESYLFLEIGKRVKEYIAAHPGKSIIKMGIGDVTRPLCPAVVSAMHTAVDDMASLENFKGYPPAAGYDFLLESIKSYYAQMGVDLSLSEIVVSDGCKSDAGNITDLFSDKNLILIPDPVYPVYVDTNIMCGRTVTFIDGNEENGFLPLPYPGLKADIIYLCSPNNPTGGVYDKAGLKAWVDFAIENKAVILFDCAYEAFVRDPNLPNSIYQIDGAKECAIEFCTFSKTAGFTGVRCGYTVIPEALKVDGMSLNKMWLRRQSTKFNGVSYISQRAAAAAYTPEGVAQTRETIEYYMANAALMAKTLESKGISFTGGKNSPYVWFKCWGGMGSWQLFDYLIDKIGVVGTPGAGFGKNGEGWMRLTAFGAAENTAEAMRRLSSIL